MIKSEPGACRPCTDYAFSNTRHAPQPRSQPGACDRGLESMSTQPNNPGGTGGTVRRGRAVRGPAPTRPCHSRRRRIVSPRRETPAGRLLAEQCPPAPPSIPGTSLLPDIREASYRGSRGPMPHSPLCPHRRGESIALGRGTGRWIRRPQSANNSPSLMNAGVAELVDAGDLKSSFRKEVRVQVPPSALVGATAVLKAEDVFRG